MFSSGIWPFLERRSDYISPSLQLNFAGGFCFMKLASVFISYRLGLYAAAPAPAKKDWLQNFNLCKCLQQGYYTMQRIPYVFPFIIFISYLLKGGLVFQIFCWAIGLFLTWYSNIHFSMQFLMSTHSFWHSFQWPYW